MVQELWWAVSVWRQGDDWQPANQDRSVLLPRCTSENLNTALDRSPFTTALPWWNQQSRLPLRSHTNTHGLSDGRGAARSDSTVLSCFKHWYLHKFFFPFLWFGGGTDQLICIHMHCSCLLWPFFFTEREICFCGKPKLECSTCQPRMIFSTGIGKLNLHPDYLPGWLSHELKSALKFNICQSQSDWNVNFYWTMNKTHHWPKRTVPLVRLCSHYDHKLERFILACFKTQRVWRAFVFISELTEPPLYSSFQASPLIIKKV